MVGVQSACAEHGPAKINLALHVTGQRPDGYHRIESLCVFTGFGDRVTVQSSAEDGFVVSGPYAAAVPSGSDNLVLRARDAFRTRFPDFADQPIQISLEKNLPPVSGVGGGSSDAAATLRAMARVFDVANNDALHSLGGALGADVPMCFAARPLIATGIGEILEPVSEFPGLHLVLVNPGVAVATPTVFSALADKRNPPLPPLPPGMNVAGLIEWLADTRNDLQDPACRLAPAIDDALAALVAEGAAFARMSGSGATCFGIFRDAYSATGAASALRAARPGWFTVATQTTA